MTFTTDPSIRFWRKVDKRGPDDCWNWTAAKNHAGYGIFCFGGRSTSGLAHRFSYELRYGKIEEGLFCLHKCDNPACVNPNHIYLGTHIENARDRVIRGRSCQDKGEKNPFHKLTQAQVDEIRASYVYGSKDFGTIALSKKYGVVHQTIHNVVTGKYWA